MNMSFPTYSWSWMVCKSQQDRRYGSCKCYPSRNAICRPCQNMYIKRCPDFQTWRVQSCSRDFHSDQSQYDKKITNLVSYQDFQPQNRRWKWSSGGWLTKKKKPAGWGSGKFSFVSPSKEHLSDWTVLGTLEFAANDCLRTRICFDYVTVILTE